MTGKYRYMISAMLMLALAVVLTACGSKTETGVCTGTLSEALGDRIVLNTDEGAREFRTDDGTVYSLGDMDHLSIDDVVDVEYHGSGSRQHADKVILREHTQKDLTFEGTVAEVTDKSVTVTGKSLTVSFVRNGDTWTRGQAEVGDEVEITYTGDLSEYPFATNITVTAKQEKQEKEEAKADTEAEAETPKTASISGIVSEFTETSVLIAIDSAKSYRFTLNKDTSITGVAKYLRIGDWVTVTYEGKINKKPAATNINIIKEMQEEIRTVNGTIMSVANDYITLSTGSKVYMLHTDKNTKFTGDKPAEDYKCEATYTGNLSSGKAVATNIYCVKQTPEPEIFTVVFKDGHGSTITKIKVEKGKAAAAPANPKRKGYIFTGWDKSFAKVTKNMTVNATWEKKIKPAPEPEPEPEPEQDETMSQNVILLEWMGEDDNIIRVVNEEDVTFGLIIEDDLDIDVDYIPEAGDKVIVTYVKESMKLIRIELIEKGKIEPDVEPDDQTPGEDAEPDDQMPGEDVEPDDQTPEEDAAPEDQSEPEEQGDPEPEPEEEPAPEPVPEPEVIISGQGEIIEGNEEKQLFTIEIDGSTIELAIDNESVIAAGYFPQKGDTVKVTYAKNGMLLKSIQLVSRPEPEPAPEPEQPADSDVPEETAAEPEEEEEPQE